MRPLFTVALKIFELKENIFVEGESTKRLRRGGKDQRMVRGPFAIFFDLSKAVAEVSVNLSKSSEDRIGFDPSAREIET